jgi:hypothetical protein
MVPGFHQTGRKLDPADKLDPIFLDFSNSRVRQKVRFLGDFLPAELPEGLTARNAFNNPISPPNWASSHSRSAGFARAKERRGW